MNTPILIRLGFGIRGLGPIVITTFLILLSTVPWPLPVAAAAPPAIGMIAAFYWAVYRPELMPPTVIFALGLLQDSLEGGPLGVGALVLLIVYGTVRLQRRFLLGKPFAVVWWGFMMTAAAAEALLWGIHSLLGGAPVDPGAAGFQFGVTVAVYPLLAWLFGWIHRGLPE